MRVGIFEHPCMSQIQVFIERKPRSGASNMARDAALLDKAIEYRTCAVRLYQWKEPTLSLGYFQHDLAIPAALATLARVRRLSGGGAIVHHHELTYSCVIPPGHTLGSSPGGLYRLIHEQIVDALREQHTDRTAIATIGDRAAGPTGSRPAAVDPRQTAEPFLCFFRRSPNDIVLYGHKIAGSAQRRRKGAVLQHGSILLRSSKYVSELKGIQDVAGEFALAGFRRRLAECIPEALRNSSIVH